MKAVMIKRTGCLLLAAALLTLVPGAALAEGETDIELAPMAIDWVETSSYETEPPAPEPPEEEPAAPELSEEEPAAEVLVEEETPEVYETTEGLETAHVFSAEEGDLAIDEENFPDPNFRAYLKTLPHSGEAGGEYFTAGQLAGITEMDCSRCDIASFEGLESFPALEKLNCSGNTPESLDIGKNTALRFLDCGSGLTCLDVSENPYLAELVHNTEAEPVEGEVSLRQYAVADETGELYAALRCGEELKLYTEKPAADAVQITAFVKTGDALAVSLLAEPAAGSDPAKYRITAEFDGQTLDAIPADGVHLIPDAAFVGLSQLTAPITVTVSCGEDESLYSFTVFDYLKALPSYTEAPLPTNQAACTGEIDGVGDFHAKLVTEGDPAVRLYFRAESADGLSFSCDGHTIGAPEKEEEGLWFVTVGDLTPADLPADLLITAAKEAQQAQIRFSPFCWAARHWEETDDPLIALCRALSAAQS